MVFGEFHPGAKRVSISPEIPIQKESILVAKMFNKEWQDSARVELEEGPRKFFRNRPSKSQTWRAHNLSWLLIGGVMSRANSGLQQVVQNEAC
ncbi:hypothetical protein RRG08_023808 [Elysia crispata]|uniref:Uncharacterized protein n=1 Tax=Elysia crispata TaxID=231223 RepID=A0AAE0ZWZ3_9GAST|nr:hypothetical protein RRG08_023808 [Elysia crispata]